MRSSVLFTIFNRPDATRESFARIRQAKPPRLYVAADGPRDSVDSDDELCSVSRELATAIDWDCEVQTLFHESNLGCGSAISTALSWFFDSEARGVIVEDDCVCDLTFFSYCDELLERFEYDENVMFIAGSTASSMAWSCPPSYRFSRVPLMWGWATWARAWSHHDQSMTGWSDLSKHRWLRDIGIRRWTSRAALIRLLDQARTGAVDTWDFQWMYSVWKENGIGVVPHQPLVRNVGFGPDATHTRSHRDTRRTSHVSHLDLPMHHPGGFLIDEEWDEYLIQEWFKTGAARLANLEFQRVDQRMFKGSLKRVSQRMKQIAP